MRVRGEKNAGRGFVGAWKRNWKRVAAGILVVILFSNEMNWADIMVLADDTEITSEAASETGETSDGNESVLSGDDLSEADSVDGSDADDNMQTNHSANTETESQDDGSAVTEDDTQTDHNANTETESQDDGSAVTEDEKQTNHNADTKSESQEDGSTAPEDDAALTKIQEMIAALPDREEVTEDNAYDVYEQLDEIYNALDDELTDDQYDRLMEMDCWTQLYNYTDWFMDKYGELVSDLMSTYALIEGNIYTDDQGVQYTIKMDSSNDLYAVVSGVDNNFAGGNITIPQEISDNNIIEVTAIEDNAFKGCTSLTSITIPYSVKSIAETAFDGCSQKITMWLDGSSYDGQGVKYSISGSGATVAGSDSSHFSGGAIILPDKVKTGTDEYNVTAIADNAFSGCTSLTSITIPYSVKSIAGTAFDGCSQKITMMLEQNSSYYYDGQGIRYSTSGLEATVAGSDSLHFSGGAIIIPDKVKTGTGEYNVTAIKDSAFSGSTRLMKCYNKVVTGVANKL